MTWTHVAAAVCDALSGGVPDALADGGAIGQAFEERGEASEEAADSAHELLTHQDDLRELFRAIFAIDCPGDGGW